MLQCLDAFVTIRTSRSPDVSIEWEIIVTCIINERLASTTNRRDYLVFGLSSTVKHCHKASNTSLGDCLIHNICAPQSRLWTSFRVIFDHDHEWTSLAPRITFSFGKLLTVQRTYFSLRCIGIHTESPTRFWNHWRDETRKSTTAKRRRCECSTVKC